MKLTGRNGAIDFQNVEALSLDLMARRSIPTRFSLEIPIADASNAVYAAMIAEVRGRGHGFEHVSDTKHHIEEAAAWLTDASGKPGLMLLGKFGNGKTTLAKAIGNLIGYITERELGYDQKIIMPIYQAKELCNLATRQDKQKEYDMICSHQILAIDDLGEEPREVLIYGQPQTPITDLLEHRYNRQLITIVTTNLGTGTLSEKYGGRIYDRMREMFKLIPFQNESFRK